MFHILGFLFIILIAILVIGLSIIGTVIRNIFGLGKHRSSSRPRPNGSDNYQSRKYSYDNQGRYSNPSQEEVQPEEGEIRPKRKKLFSKDEGEYVDYEEIKE